MGKSRAKKQRAHQEAVFKERARQERINNMLSWGQWYGGPQSFWRKFYLDCPACGAQDLLDVQQQSSNYSRTGFHCLNCDHWQYKYKCNYCNLEKSANEFHGLLNFGPCCSHCVKTKDVGLKIGYKSKGRFYQLN